MSANRVRWSLDRVYVHFFVSRQRNGDSLSLWGRWLAERDGEGGEGGEGDCANRVRCSLDRVYVHFFVSRQRNGTKENALRGSAPKYPVGLCAFCPWGTKLHSTVASLLPRCLHNPASFSVSLAK